MENTLEFDEWYDYLNETLRAQGYRDADRDTAYEDYQIGKGYEESAQEFIDEWDAD